MPTVSIIVPVFRVEAYLENCVRSLRGQTMGDVVRDAHSGAPEDHPEPGLRPRPRSPPPAPPWNSGGSREG